MDITFEIPGRPVRTDHVTADITGAGQTLSLGTAAISMLGRQREGRVMRHWNEACHRRTMDPTR
jgi:hypothetical protein